MSKPPKNNQSCLRDEEWIISGQTSKGTVEVPARGEPIMASTSAGCPMLADKPRTPLLAVGSRDEQQHGLGKRLLNVN
jgi:hypothetical protein